MTDPEADLHPVARLLLTLVLTATVLAITPPTSQAHEGCFEREASAAEGALGVAIDAGNVFAAFVDTTTLKCDNPYNQVVIRTEREWVGDSAIMTADGPQESFGSGQGADNQALPKTDAKCKNGMAAGEFPCDDIDMLAHLTHAELGVGQGDIPAWVNDMWGWTDDHKGKHDYVLLGSGDGVTFVDITKPKEPVVMGLLPAEVYTSRYIWRDVKVHDDHMYVVSENDDHGVQVFDLTRLRDWDGTFTTYEADNLYTGLGSAHNIFVNEDTGYGYVIGAREMSASGDGSEGRQPRSCDAGLHMLDLSDPGDPTFAGCYSDAGYVHDVQCVVYDGPDEVYEDREICFASNGLSYSATGPNFLTIVDVTDKASPALLSRTTYPGSGYSHQGWLTEDQDFFLADDEGDELLTGVNTTTHVWDVSDLDAPTVSTLVHETTSIDHNLYIEGDHAIMANYTSGLRQWDIDDIDEGGAEQIAFFDVYPDNDNNTFEGGAWSNYPYFHKNKVVAVSSIDQGLFILRTQAGD